MINNIYTIEELTELLHPIFQENKVKKAILFGSYARGEARVNSDIDLIIDSELTGLDFFGLVENVHLVLKKRVDLINLRDLKKGSPIEEEIRTRGIRIYG